METSLFKTLSQLWRKILLSPIIFPLSVHGEGTFGDVLDPNAIASPRYTEVKLSDFAKDLGFFEGLADIDYVKNYDTQASRCFHGEGEDGVQADLDSIWMSSPKGRKVETEVFDGREGSEEVVEGLGLTA